jgi:hypothetical protein
MRNSLFAAVAVVCGVCSARAADEENPFKKSKVGDYVEYKTAISSMGASR